MNHSRPKSQCTPEDFLGWRLAMRWSRAQASMYLGIGTSTVLLYEKGERFDGGRKVYVPHVVALAAAALEAGLSPIGSGSKNKIENRGK